MGDTTIQWTNKTWNPIRGCSRVSQGCVNCYAERQAARFAGSDLKMNTGELAKIGPFRGFVTKVNGHPQWTGKVELIEKHLLDPLRWKQPQRVFVNSMSDLFHENLPDEAIDRVFAVMALCPQHTFQILTKRPERMLRYFTEDRGHAVRRRVQDVIDPVGPNDERICDKATGYHAAMKLHDGWPLPNVWLGVSVENQRPGCSPRKGGAVAESRKFTCDVCGAEKREANHWFVVLRYEGRAAILTHVDAEKTAVRHNVKPDVELSDACGERCAMVKLERYFAAPYPMPTEGVPAA